MVNIEFEIHAEDSKEYLYALRNYLNERIADLQVSIKEQPALEGQMSPFTAEGILNGVIHAGIGLSIETCVHMLLPVLKDFLKQIPAHLGKKVEILATMGDGAGRVTLSEDSEGVSKIYNNVTYSIDTGHTRAILIGVGEFDFDFHPIPPVQNNVEDFYKLLTDKRNIGLLPENISIALNKTNTEIEELLLRVSKLADTETLLIYFSGHGYRSDVNKLHLIARNTRKIDDYILGGVDYDFIKNLVLKSSPAKQKIVILDACHSGIATQGANDAILDLNVTGTYILASSESDEVSYYDKNKRNTFFTGSLLDTLTNGIDNAREMLALNDLYENARIHLDQRQQPRFKDKLNISASDFFIARNPCYSLEKYIQQAEQLFKDGNLPEAQSAFRKILKVQPGNQQVKDLAEQCNNDLLFSQFMKQGDEYFYKHQQYQQALNNYRQAYEIKVDNMTAEKIRSCKAFLSESKQPVADELKQTEEIPANNVVKPVIKKEKKLADTDNEESEKKSIPAKVLVIVFGVLVALIGWWILKFIDGHEEKTDFTQLSAMLDSVPDQALNLLRVSKEKDSAYYTIGNYYRADKKMDSAVYYYEKAIAVSNLPSAYSALASIYYNNEIQDSTRMRSPYDILKTADSLFKADTSAYYMLGSLAQRKTNALSTTAKPDIINALKDEQEHWWLKGFKKGCKQCGIRLGVFYLGIRDQPAIAYPYLKTSAENNDRIAQLYISDMLLHGYGVTRDTTESERWFQQFLLNATALDLLQSARIYSGTGNTFYPGYPFERDCSKAVMICTEAEKRTMNISNQHEQSDAYLELGNFYYFNTASCRDIIKGGHVKAREYYRKAESLGNGVATLYLADSTQIQ